MPTKLVSPVFSVDLCERIVEKLQIIGVSADSIGVITNKKTELADIPDTVALGLVTVVTGSENFDALASSLIGVSVPRIHLQEYEEAINEGSLLLVIHVEDEDERFVRDSILNSFPSVRRDDYRHLN